MSQEEIWQFFQGDGVQNFDDAIPRLDHLFKIARRHGGDVQRQALNIGVGNGWLERRCREAGWRVSALDPGEDAIANLVKDGIDGRVGYIEKMPFENDSFDTVFCSEVLEHLDDHQLQNGLLEIRRVLKPQGILIGTVPYRENLFEGVVICPDCGKKFHRWGHQQSFDKGRFNQVIADVKMEMLVLQTYAFPVYSKSLPLNRVRQYLRWILGRIGSGHVHTNLLFTTRSVK